jgi:hypothetical protein
MQFAKSKESRKKVGLQKFKKAAVSRSTNQFQYKAYQNNINYLIRTLNLLIYQKNQIKKAILMIRKELALPAIVLKLENCDFGNFRVDVEVRYILLLTPVFSKIYCI